GGQAAVRRPPSRPRMANEETREVTNMPGGNTAESGLLPLEPPTDPGPSGPSIDDLDNIGDRTLITGAPHVGFMMDVATEDGVDATMVSAGPPQPDDTDDNAVDEMEDGETLTGQRPQAPLRSSQSQSQSDEDGPTVQREFTAKPRVTAARGSQQAPAALAAKIHAPAVSELRKPRGSRKTPGAGVPQQNVLQAIVGSQASEPMPAPMPSRSQA